MMLFTRIMKSSHNKGGGILDVISPGINDLKQVPKINPLIFIKDHINGTCNNKKWRLLICQCQM